MTALHFGLSDDEFRRANERPMAALGRMHPGFNEADLVRALREATVTTGEVGNARLIAAAIILLDE